MQIGIETLVDVLNQQNVPNKHKIVGAVLEREFAFQQERLAHKQSYLAQKIMNEMPPETMGVRAVK